MKDIKTLTDVELVEYTHELAGSVSYYNAAEGNWSRETDARNACKSKFYDARQEMRERGLEFENRGYLL